QWAARSRQPRGRRRRGELMRVLVTGAGGFVGRALVPALVQAGHSVVATDRACAGLQQLGADEVVEGDIADPKLREAAIASAQAAIHLATIPGGAAEIDPPLARRINVQAAMALSEEFSAQHPTARFVFASSVAVFGHPLPPRVDDDTPVLPRMIYGAHKAMLETWLATLTRRGDLSAVSLRLPGIVARPPTPSGLKSAYMSDVFHALRHHSPIELPVSPDATMWLMSVNQVARCLARALELAPVDLPPSSAATLPALRVSMAELVAELCRQCEADPGLVSYVPDPEIEMGFGRQPPLITREAERLGFFHDGDVTQLVRSALATLTPEIPS
ncbi:MAG TPA: NAD-dependent epimerase/dehydratase family protein, partial [Reyranella sp.]|nr:NAD-dependent epimerase/dehydratase family protein [Reyranella sp.]